MNASALAETMLRWERQRRLLDELEEVIREAVLEIGKTQTVGNVRASFSGGRKAYDYQAGAMMVLDQTDAEAQRVINRYTAPVVDWRAVCQDIGLDSDAIPYQQGNPSVSIKLLE